MKIKGLPLGYWLKHPRDALLSLKVRRWPVVNLDEPERNCEVCGFDHHHLTEDNLAAYQEAHLRG